MEPYLKLALILAIVTFAEHAQSEALYASENPIAVGSNVTLHSPTSVKLGVWLFNSEMVVFITPVNGTFTAPWRKRAAYDTNTSSLEIIFLTLEDSGTYTLQDVNEFRADLTLSVQVPISNVTLRAQATNLVEYNDTAVLMCSVSTGTSLSYVWLKGNNSITAGEHVHFSDDGATLSMRVTRYDQGPFRCNVSNGVSNEISHPIMLSISYGPSNVTLTVTPEMSTYMMGSNITLSCSAESSPAAMVQWLYDGVSLNHYGPHLKLENVTQSLSGNYMCLFNNSVTLRYSHASTMIWILDPITSVVVIPSGPATLHDPLTLHCETEGTVDSIHWKKDGHHIYADNTTIFGMGNKTLTLNSVQKSDSGKYVCQAFNVMGNVTSKPYTVVVYYGPETPTIKGQAYAETGHHAVFSCFAMSVPPSTYSWWFKNMSVGNTSELVTERLTLNMSGEYICKAYNNITMKNSKSSKMLTVIEAIKSVMIQNSSVPIQNENFALTCVVDGPYDSIYWMKDNMTLNMNSSMMNSSMMNGSMMNGSMMNSSMMNGSMMNGSMMNGSMINGSMMNGSMMNGSMSNGSMINGSMINGSMSNGSMPHPHMPYYIKNNTLYFNPVTTYNDGAYRCVATNRAARHKSPEHMLLVNYGPLSVTISGPYWTSMGTKVSLKCSADSRPECEFYWYFDNLTTPLNGGSVITFPVTLHTLGKYICMARNPVTNITMYQSKLLAIAASGPDSTIYFASRSSLMMMVIFALSATVLFN